MTSIVLLLLSTPMLWYEIKVGPIFPKAGIFFLRPSSQDYKKAFALARKEIVIHIIKQLESVF